MYLELISLFFLAMYFLQKVLIQKKIYIVQRQLILWIKIYHATPKHALGKKDQVAQDKKSLKF